MSKVFLWDKREAVSKKNHKIVAAEKKDKTGDSSIFAINLPFHGILTGK